MTLHTRIHAAGLALASLSLPAILCAQESAIDEAMAAMTAGNLEKAESVARTGLQTFPKNPALLDILAVVLDRENKLQDADGVYREAVVVSPRSASIRNNYGNHLLAMDRPLEAKAQFQAAIATDASNLNANVQLARLALQQKRGADALSYLAHLTDADRQSGPVLLLSGLAASNAGRAAEAENDLISYQRLKPEDFQANYLLGLAAAKMNHLDRAQTALAAAHDRQPENTEVLYDLAVVHLRRKHALDALAALSRAGALAPKNSDIQRLLALTAADCGYFEDASNAWDRYLEQVPDDEAARRERAFVRTAVGHDSKAALSDLRAYVSKHPNDAVGHYELGVATSGTENRTADAELTKALQLNKTLTAALVARGLLNYRIGNVDAAVTDFTAASQQEPRNGRVWDRLGEAHAAANQPQLAIAALRKAATLAPDDPSVLLHLGRALEKIGERAEAASAFAHYRQLKTTGGGPSHEAGFVEFLGLPPAEQQARYRAGVQRTAEAQPNNAEAQTRYLELVLQDGKTDEAARVSSAILALKPNADLLTRTADLLVEAGQFNLAETFTAKAIESVGPSERLQVDLAEAKFHAVGAQAGLNALEQISPESRTPRFYLARTQMVRSIGPAGVLATALK